MQVYYNMKTMNITKNATIMSLDYEYNIKFDLSMTINKGVKLILV